MSFATIDGIKTRYEVVGSGPPLLMYAPAGFDATLEKWTTQGVYARAKMMEHLPKKFSCIVFDRRECGQSGGRLERVTWAHYVAQGKALLEHLGHKRAHLIGGCMGCCPVALFGIMHPEMVISSILYWPVGGAKYRISTHARFTEHLAYTQNHTLEEVIARVKESGKSFGADPAGGPWAAPLRTDAEFAKTYAKQDIHEYRLLVNAICRTLFDRDTSPGAEPEDLLRCKIPTLVVPGHDDSHATSAARYMEECLPSAEYWDMPVAGQTEETVSPKLVEFLEKTAA